MPNKNDELLSLWSELFIAHPLAIRKVETLLKGKAPLGLDEYDILLILSRSAKHSCRFSTLAEESLYTKSGVSRVVKRLIDRGYIRKEGCEEDRRVFYAILTAEGVKALKKTWEYYSEAIISVLSPCFNYEKATELRKLLGSLVDHLRDAPPVPMPKIEK